MQILISGKSNNDFSRDHESCLAISYIQLYGAKFYAKYICLSFTKICVEKSTSDKLLW